MRGRKPDAKPVIVTVGPWAGSTAKPATDAPTVEQPNWLMEHKDGEGDWGKRRAEIAKKRFDELVVAMTERGTLDKDNNALIEMAAGAYADWKLAEAHVTTYGPIVPAPKSSVPMHNPYKAIADAAFKRMVMAEDRLGIPPVERGRATKAGSKAKKKSPADAYLGGTAGIPAWAPKPQKK